MDMLLALDTATRTVSLALYDGHALLAESAWRSGNHHTAELAPAVAETLARAGVAPGALRGVAVALGPGSFTALRVGLALARGLALAHNLPLIGAPTLDILARAQPPRSEPMLAVLQAGRGRLAVGRYLHGEGGWAAQGGASLYRWPDLVRSIEVPSYLCGEIDAEGRAALRRLRSRVTLAPASLSLRRAGVLAEMAWARLEAGQTDDAATLAPLYLRDGEGA